MPENSLARRVCRDCDGFATATITTGLRTDDGARDTIPVHCTTCRGTGTRTAPTTLARAGR
ncbi:hypothetical protein AB0G79_02825 [Streptomyces sp. NPDC020807]|uniref:hypothetical protein n=1 Tax=Streptomyces sp. NPDC020807 TaxID=3155119 RepID=UPI0033FB2144